MFIVLQEQPIGPHNSIFVHELSVAETPQKTAHLMSLRKAIKTQNRQLKQLRMKLNVIVEKDGVQVDEHL